MSYYFSRHFFLGAFLIGLERGAYAYYRPTFPITYFRNQVTKLQSFHLTMHIFLFSQQAKEKAVYRDTYSLVTTLRFLYNYPPSGDSFEQRLNDSPCSNRSEDGNKTGSG